jgi:hypothetical protein
MCSQHILNTGHSYGQLDETMDIIHVAKIGKYMNSLEKLYIYIKPQNMDTAKWHVYR